PLLEQAQQLATAGRNDKAESPDKKTPAGAMPPASERLAISTAEAKGFRADEVVKVAATAPVTPPSDAPAVPPVQALRLEVERPDLGQVALRVVLADQTVHA